MMAPHLGGRPGSSRRVRLVPVRHSSMDHRAVARIVLALARQMAAEADETVDSAAVDEVVSSGTGASVRNEPGASDGSAAGSDAAAPWAGAHSGQSVRGVASVGRCAACRHRLGVAWQDGVLTSVMTVLATWLMAPLPRRPTPCRIALVRLNLTRPLLRLLPPFPTPCRILPVRLSLTRQLLRLLRREAPRDGPPRSAPGVVSAPLCLAARPGHSGGVGGSHPGR